MRKRLFKIKRWLKKRLDGYDIAMDWKTGMATVRIKRWYIPLLMLQGLYAYHFPLWSWPRLFWRYYITKEGH